MHLITNISNNLVAKGKNTDGLFAKANVIGVGVGFVGQEGKKTGECMIQVLNRPEGPGVRPDRARPTARTIDDIRIGVQEAGVPRLLSA